MSKRKKTRQQKIIADLRRQSQRINAIRTQDTTPAYAIDEQTIPQSKTFLVKEKTSVPYLIYDLRRTGLVTIAIITAQIILFLILRNHILKFPGLSY